MNKCPHCGAILKTLTRVCEACGSEIKPEATASSESSTATPAVLGAADLSTQINASLSILKSHPPASKIKSFIIGLITIPTVGLGYLAAKFFDMLGRTGQSPERTKLSLDQNLRAVETSFKSDPEMKSLVEQGRTELKNYIHSQHETRMFLVYGMIASLILCVSIPLVIQHQAKVRMEKVAAIAQAEAEAAKKKMEQAAAIAQAQAAEEKANLEKKIAEVQKNPFKSLCVGPIIAINSVEQKTAQNGQSANLQQILETLDTTLIDQANGSHKFDIVGRKDTLKSIYSEQDFGATGGVDPATAAQLYKLVGAQYLVLTTVTDFAMGNETAKFDAIGVTANKEAVRISCNVQIYDTTTGKLIESARFRGQDANIVREGSATAAGSVITKITDRLASDIITRVVNAIYPAKVAAKEGSQITINQGEGAGVVIGQVWNIYALGTEITDPDTGKKLGQNENEVGKIKINRITTQLSYGEVVADNGIAIGSIARPQPAATAAEPAAAAVPAATPATGQKPADILEKVKGDL
jgi:hypothetical protein